MVVEILHLFLCGGGLQKKERDDKKKDEDQSCGMMDKGRDGERRKGNHHIIFFAVFYNRPTISRRSTISYIKRERERDGKKYKKI